ncbi:hypothetical protein S83_027702 [Arachis hypogaea]
MDSVCSEFQGKLNILAHMALHDIDAAVESFKNALVLEPNDGNPNEEGGYILKR